MTNSRVFVIQEMNRFNYSDAERFGELVFATNIEFRPYKSMSNEDIIKAIGQMAIAFNPDEDYLLMTGNPITMSYAFHKILSKRGYVKLLQWDGIQRKYQDFQFKESDYIN